MILVTGAAGFIGGNFVHHWFAHHDEPVIALDKLTYAGNAQTLAPFMRPGQCTLVRGDIADRALVAQIFADSRPRAVLHFAAESHVDRSISGPDAFVQTNVVGTFCLLDEARSYWTGLNGEERDAFRFLHVSTDEVYGSLKSSDPPFTEATAYAPNSPYASTKAGSDHLVRAYHHTYGLPTLTTNCSNNYGPFQFPEKLIPLMILNALEGKPLPVYGDGLNVRDWLYVRDHCDAIEQVLARGEPGETYNIGGNNEVRNIDVVTALCRKLDALRPRSGGSYEELISFVKDRPGHDRRYAIDAGKIEREIGWRPHESFESGIDKTVDWHLQNMGWVNSVRSGEYRRWIATHYADVAT